MLRLLRRTVDDEVLRKQEVDLIVTPTIRELPWSIDDELTRAANTRARNPKPGNTRSLDDYGLPTITMPCGFSKSGSPIGLQISGASRKFWLWLMRISARRTGMYADPL